MKKHFALRVAVLSLIFILLCTFSSFMVYAKYSDDEHAEIVSSEESGEDISFADKGGAAWFAVSIAFLVGTVFLLGKKWPKGISKDDSLDE